MIALARSDKSDSIGSTAGATASCRIGSARSIDGFNNVDHFDAMCGSDSIPRICSADDIDNV